MHSLQCLLQFLIIHEQDSLINPADETNLANIPLITFLLMGFEVVFEELTGIGIGGSADLFGGSARYQFTTPVAALGPPGPGAWSG